MVTKGNNKSGLYIRGEFISSNPEKMMIHIYGKNMSTLVDDWDYPGYSVIDNRGVQYIWELDKQLFEEKLTELIER